MFTMTLIFVSASPQALAPPGWKVHPEEIVVDIDGENDACSKGEDLIFTLEGFSIRGKIQTKDSQTGPPNIRIHLKGDGGTLLGERDSDAEGAFEFNGIAPGKYQIQIAEEHSQRFSFERAEQSIQVLEDSVVLPPFFIFGYDVEGTVTSSVPKGSLAGILFELVPENKNSNKPGGSPEKQRVTSGPDGKFKFSNVTSGNYRLVAGPTQSVSLGPASRDLVVHDRNLDAGSFEIQTFSLEDGGQVLTSSSSSNGKALSGAKITVNGNPPIISDANGRFEVKNVGYGALKVSIEHAEYRFDDVSLELLDPFQKLAPFTPGKLKVSGKVELGQGQTVSCNIEGSDSSTNTALIEEDGSFQMFLNVDKTFSCLVLNPSGSPVGGYIPLKHTVHVKSERSTLTQINFNLAKLTIKGKLQYLSKEKSKSKSGAEVSIRPEAGSASEEFTSAVNGAGEFQFTNVLPGVYQITVQDESHLCWEESSIRREIGENISNLKFVQKGYNVLVEAPHDMEFLVGVGDNINRYSVERGRNTVCFTGERGALDLSTQDCHEYRFTPAQISPAKDRALKLESLAITVPIQIKSEQKIPDLKIRATKRGDVEELSEGVEETNNNAKGVTTVNFRLKAVQGVEVLIEPVSKLHFFTPSSLLLEVKSDCKANSVSFKSQTGHFIQGQITPAVEGVLVKLEKEQFKNLETQTGKDGKFKLGPLREEVEEPLVLFKSNYAFQPIAGKYGHFTSSRLASVTVKVLEAPSSPLSEAVVSISGDKSYRNLSKTVDGLTQFHSLLPGEYFVKAFLKEYSFEPKNHVVSVANGVFEKSVEFVGRRVAYSAHGKVTYINGKEEAGIVIFAHGDCDQHREDATSQADGGSFKLSGLKPKCSYTLESGSPEVEKILMPQSKIAVENADLNLAKPALAIRKNDLVDCTLLIKSDSSTTLPSSGLLEVTLKEEDGGDLHKVIRVPTNEITFLSQVFKLGQQKTYSVEVRGQKQTFVPVNNFHHFVFDITRSGEGEGESGKTSAGMKQILPLLAVIGVGALVKYVYQYRTMKM